MADVKVIGAPQSTFVRTTRMALEEKGVAYDLEPAGPGAPELLAVNPYGKMPGFRHGDLVLHETPAITRYIDAAFDGPALRPRDAKGEAEMDRWISVCCDYLYDDAIRAYVLQYIFPTGPDGAPDAAAVTAGRDKTASRLATMEQALASGEGPYLCGAQYTLADAFLAPILFYVGNMPDGAALLDAAPRVKAVQAAIADRPSFAATMPPMPE